MLEDLTQTLRGFSPAALRPYRASFKCPDHGYRALLNRGVFYNRSPLQLNYWCSITSGSSI